ncbi:MAG: hypothetical protein PVJ57_09180 [Phycisphaerae bacterium]
MRRVLAAVAATIFLVAVLSIAYFSSWQRGPYSDDYIFRDHAHDAVTGERRPLWHRERIETYPARALNYVVTGFYAERLPDHEGLARVVMAANVLLNAVLAGLLALRLARSRVAAWVAGVLMLAPCWTWEVLLWVSASGYLAATALTLVAMHAFLSGVRSRFGALLFAVSAASLSISLFIIEQPAMLAIVLPVLAVNAIAKAEPQRRKRQAFRAALALTVHLVLFLLVFFVLSRGSDTLVAVRGGLVCGLDEWVGQCQRLWHHLAGLRTGVFADSFAAAWMCGRSLTLGTGFGRGAFVACLIALGALLAFCPEFARRSDAPHGAAWLVFGVGVCVAVFTAFFPASLVRNQAFEVRMLYVPTIGAALASGGLAAAMAEFVRAPRLRIWVTRAIVATTGGGALICAITTAGYAHGYALRGQMDERQLRAAALAFAHADLPHGTVFAPIAIYDASPDMPPKLSVLYTGVLEILWAARPELARILGHRDFDVVVSSHWTGTVFSVPTSRTDNAPLLINGMQLAPETTLPFTYINGDVVVISQLTVCAPAQDTLRSDVSSAAAPPLSYSFPLAEELARRGVPSIQCQVRAGIPEYDLQLAGH